MKPLIKGDYVLATKYHDGDPQDGWVIGFYGEPYLHCGTDLRHMVVDEKGNHIGRANGYRRAKIISNLRGLWILANADKINQSSFRMWHFARCSMNLFNPPPTATVPPLKSQPQYQ